MSSPRETTTSTNQVEEPPSQLSNANQYVPVSEAVKAPPSIADASPAPEWKDPAGRGPGTGVGSPRAAAVDGSNQ